MIAEVVSTRGTLTQETLALAQDLVNAWSITPFFVIAARTIAQQANAQNPRQEAFAVHSWIRSNVAYRSDPVGTQWVQDPFETMAKTKSGNCVNMAILAATLLQAIGHPCKIAAVQWRGRPIFSHAVCIDKLTGLVVDPVNPTFATWPKNQAPQSVMEAL